MTNLGSESSVVVINMVSCVGAYHQEWIIFTLGIIQHKNSVDECGKDRHTKSLPMRVDKSYR